MHRTQITAVLGPTNTGKTHYAIERMLSYPTGVIGLPLRLLAREVYDRVVAVRGPRVVALVTGEERIVPPKAQYWVCTVEAMPDLAPDFLAIDEIQLCADPERGHIFTDRLLHARGRHETLLLGADTMRPTIAAMVPKAQFIRRDRFSTLTYAGPKKISRMPPRSAIVGFSVEQVYAIAELLRRTKGGAAVVMGALSPRTRNAQVDLYQNGDVDFLVATDAIGMGLNLDVRHVAFSGLRKFDGRRMRDLMPNELAQIAGRAGRYKTDGSFGVTGEAPPLDEPVVEAITEHRFAPIKKLQWRNSALDFGTIHTLLRSLETSPDSQVLVRAREADDQMALQTLSEQAEVTSRLSHPRDVEQLWSVCRIPDFRGISAAEHATLLQRIFGFLQDRGEVPDDWLSRQIRRIDRTDGDIEALSKRLAFIRTWTYVAQRPGWVGDETHWRDATRAVEDRLSDALHSALTQRFVDRRTSVLMRRLKQKESLVAEVNDKGEVTVEAQNVGRIEGFRFTLDKSASAEEAKTLRQAAFQAMKPEFVLRADRFYNSPDTEIDFTEQGGLMWGSHAVGKLVKGSEPLKPVVQAFVDEEAGPDVIEKVTRRLQHFIDRKIATLYEPLLAMSKDEAMTGLARGFAFRLMEGFGVLPRDMVASEVKALEQDARSLLRKHGVRFGQFTIFLPLLLKPAPTRLRLVMWSLWEGVETFPESPPPGLVTIPTPEGVGQDVAAMSGYRIAGARAVRIDMLERLADQIRTKDTRAGFEATADMLSITGTTLEQFADLMQGLGYKAEKGEREKVKPVVAAKAEAEVAEQVVGAEATSAEPETGAEATQDAAQTDSPSDAEAAPAEAAAPEAVEEVTQTASDTSEAAGAEPTDAEQKTSDDAPGSQAEATGPQEADAEVPASEEPAADLEVFYTFSWAPKRQGGGRPRHQSGARDGAQRDAGQRRGGEAKRGDGGSDAKSGDKGRDGGKRHDGGRSDGKRNERSGGGGGGGGGKPKGKRPPKDANKGGERSSGGRRYEARPPKKDKPIDPDNPFAALLALKDKT